MYIVCLIIFTFLLPLNIAIYEAIKGTIKSLSAQIIIPFMATALVYGYSGKYRECSVIVEVVILILIFILAKKERQ